jgi:hypothetical protein
MTNSSNPFQFRSPSSQEKNYKTDSRIKPLGKTHMNNWLVQWILIKDIFCQFWLRKQTNQINHDNEVNNLDDLENSVTWSFITLAFFSIIWMYFFYRWPTHHPELFAIAIGIPICFVSFRLIQFVKKHKHK